MTSPPKPDRPSDAQTSEAQDAAGFARSRAKFSDLLGALRQDAGLTAWRIGAAVKRRRGGEERVAAAPVGANEGGSTRWSRRRRLAFGGLAVVAAGMLVVFAVAVWALKDVPWREIAAGTLDPVVVLEAADGTPIVTEGAYRGPPARVADYPQHFIDAVVATEDRRFFEHGGLDFRGIGRALMRNLSAGAIVEGGSTITQQVVKVSYLERDRTLKRKVQEAVIALWMDWWLGKEEILTRYLNSIYLGAGATGVPAAARIYFDKEPGDLTLAESAMIAGLIRAPSALNPLSNPEGARKRAAVVLDGMVAAGKIDEAEAAGTKVDYADLKPSRPEYRSGSWFADWTVGQARELAGGFAGTLHLRTTLVPALQELAQRSVNEVLEEAGSELGSTQAALVAMTPDGAVVSMVGGRNYKESSFNRAVTAKRQPGSTFKLFVYYAALEAGMPLRAPVMDEPVEIDGWSPENAGGRYRGRVSLAEAFARSLNAATVNLAMEVGIDRVIETARALGIESELANTPSVALGSSEVSLLEMTSAYAAIRAGATPVRPFGIASILGEGEGTPLRVTPAAAQKQLGPARDEMITLLELAVDRGTGQAARLRGPAAGKTGTSQDYRDAWFIGFDEDLVVGVWIGNDDDSPMPEVSGGDAPARIWQRFMEGAGEALAAQPVAAQEGGAPQCNIDACSRAYRSFRASDCTFQPYGGGGRKLCEK